MKKEKSKIIISNYDDVKNPDYGGGGAVAVHEIAKRLADKFEVTVITGNYHGAIDKTIDNVKYKRVKTCFLGAKIGQIAYHFLLPFYAMFIEFDLWIESFTPPFSTSFLPIFTKKPVIGLAHMLSGEDMKRKYKIPFHLIEKIGLKTYRYFIVLSEEARGKIKNLNKKARIEVISNGVYLPQTEGMPDKKHILFIGRIEVNQKGLDLLLKAYSIISEKIDYKLAIAGAGVDNELIKLKNMIASLNLKDKVEMLGRISGAEKSDIFKKSAFVVAPSRFESFSLVALEALSYGLPIVSFDIDGLKWIPPQCCSKAEAFDETDLSQKILELSQDGGLRQKMGDAGRQFASRFDWKEKAEEYENFISEILNQTADLEKIISNIVENKKPCVFISPHLDDAMFSAGGLILELAGKTNVTIATVFTKAESSPRTLSAKNYLSISGYKGAPSELFEARRQEDIRVCKMAGVNFTHLGFTDALWRKKEKTGFIGKLFRNIFPEISHLYPFYRFNIISGKPAKGDSGAIGDIKKELLSLVGETDNAVIFCPIGAGNHVDHIIIRDICAEIFPQAVFWADFPYRLDFKPDNGFISKTSLSPCVWGRNLSRKKDLILEYKTQAKDIVPLLTGDADNVLEEIFYITNKTMFDPEPKQHNLRKLAGDAATDFPPKIGGFIFVKELFSDKKAKRFDFAVYEDKTGKRAIAKQWNKKNKYINHYWLVNEINAYREIHRAIANNPEIGQKYPDINIPRLLGVSKEEDNLTMLIEEVDGQSLAILPFEKQIAVFQNVIEYLSFLWSKMDSSAKKILIKRRTWHVVAIFPFIFTMAVIKHPKRFPYLFRGAFAFGLCVLRALRQRETVLTHRDLYLDNIIIKDGRAWLIDFQISVIANPAFETVGLVSNLWKHTDFRDKVYDIGITNFVKQDINKFYVYKTLSIYTAFYNLGALKSMTPEQAFSYLDYSLGLKLKDKIRKTLFLKKARFFIVSKSRLMGGKIFCSFSNFSNFLSNNKKHVATAGIMFFCAFILAISLRGIPGNPTAQTLNNPEWKEEGPFELSPDRGRFALTYSLVEDGSFQFSLPLARFIKPDVGYVNGRYVSLFNPGVSFFIIPGYVVGKYFGAGQVGAFATIAFFALLNIALIRAIAMRLGAYPLAANLGALAFAFASPAFAYAVSLYQHHISTFLLLSAIYSVIRWNKLWSVALVWFLFALALVVDNPNIFFMFPVAIYALGKIIFINQKQDKIKINFKLAGALTFLTIIFPAVFFMWFNYKSYGNAFQLPGTIKSVQEIDELGNPTISKLLQNPDGSSKQDLISGASSQEEAQPTTPKKKKTAVGFFKTRNLLNGFYVHMISPDRGIVRFAPVMLFGILYLYKRNLRVINLLIAVIGANLLLYSMWGDPWGGWAFGSRYLIPTYALLGIGIALAVMRFKKNYFFITFFIMAMGYSVWVNSLGAVTSNKNPPQPEILALEKVSGREEKYTYMRNWDELKNGRSKSFVFQTKAKNYVNAIQYHQIIYISIILLALAMIFFLNFGENLGGKLKVFKSKSFSFMRWSSREIKNTIRGKAV